MGGFYGNVSVARAAVEVLARAGRPLLLEEILVEVSHLLGRAVLPHSLRAALYYHLRGDDAWFERLGRGRYRLAPHGRKMAAA